MQLRRARSSRQDFPAVERPASASVLGSAGPALDSKGSSRVRPSIGPALFITHACPIHQCPNSVSVGLDLTMLCNWDFEYLDTIL